MTSKPIRMCPMSASLPTKRPLALAVAVTLLVLSAPGAARAACRNASVVPTTPAEIARAERATVCLLNRERRKAGRARMRDNRKLGLAGARHAVDMLFYGYFAHERGGGATFDQRIIAAGYTKRAGGWSLGENIGWSIAPGATPRAMVRAWMASPGHRKNILYRRFRDAGVAIVYWTGTLPDPNGSLPTTPAGAVPPSLSLVANPRMAGVVASAADARVAQASSAVVGGVYGGSGPVLVYVNDFGRRY